jgi:hypothetical protein
MAIPQTPISILEQPQLPAPAEGLISFGLVLCRLLIVEKEMPPIMISSTAEQPAISVPTADNPFMRSTMQAFLCKATISRGVLWRGLQLSFVHRLGVCLRCKISLNWI